MSDKGAVLETEYTAIDVRCPNCRSVWEVPVARFVNVETHPEARLGILMRTMHHTHCPVCRSPRDVETIFDYYDPGEGIIIQVRPAWELAAGGGENWYWARYEDLVRTYAAVDVRVDVVFGFDAMIEKHLGGAEAVEVARQEGSGRVMRACRTRGLPDEDDESSSAWVSR